MVRKGRKNGKKYESVPKTHDLRAINNEHRGRSVVVQGWMTILERQRVEWSAFRDQEKEGELEEPQVLE
jgi:hypothetical protein